MIRESNFLGLQLSLSRKGEITNDKDARFSPSYFPAPAPMSSAKPCFSDTRFASLGGKLLFFDTWLSPSSNAVSRCASQGNATLTTVETQAAGYQFMDIWHGGWKNHPHPSSTHPNTKVNRVWPQFPAAFSQKLADAAAATQANVLLTQILFQIAK